MEELMNTLKAQVIEQLSLHHLKPEDIGNDEPLFVEGIGLDSIDALELIVLMQQKYHIKLARAEDGPKIFRSIRTMAEFITENQPDNAAI